MDPDRKSTVSSFYGAPKSSSDALNADFVHPTPGRARDDASSFYNPERPSTDHLTGGPRPSAGYNRGSFFHAGREEPLKGGRDEEEIQDDAWDVYADFNNAGPRYSNNQTPQGYQMIEPMTPKLEDVGHGGPVEMVTVPALGAEWGKEELHNMTKAAKRERKSNSRKDFWKSWNRGERGLCGRYCTRRVFVFAMFATCVVIALVLGFTIPRVPAFSFDAAKPLVNATGEWANAVPTIFSRAPANFSFPAFASLEVDTNGNYLPLHFKYIRASVFDLGTQRLVGTGRIEKQTLPAKAFPDLQLPLNFTYIATNSSDQTWNNWYDACKNRAIVPGGDRIPLQFRLVLFLGIIGLPTEHSVSTQITDAPCPFELPINSA